MLMNYCPNCGFNLTYSFPSVPKTPYWPYYPKPTEVWCVSGKTVDQKVNSQDTNNGKETSTSN